MASVNDEVLFATLIELADTTTTGFDLVSMADMLVGACVELLGVKAAGIMLADQRKSLRVFASSDEETRILELLELQNNDGPCLEAFRTGTPIDGVDLSRHTDRWPRFAAAAMAAGFHTAYAVPMRLRNQTIGALNLFLEGVEPLSAHKINVARVLADMAAIGIINHWSLRQQEVLAEQLQSALNTRVIIEQAKGVVAERQGISPREAFEYLRATARASERSIADVAIETVNGQEATQILRPIGPAAGSPRQGPPRLTPVRDDTDKSSSGTDVLVDLREQRVDPEVRSADPVTTATELIGRVYLVSPADALDILDEASHALQRSLPDIAASVVAEGRLPEVPLLNVRRQQRHSPTPRKPAHPYTPPRRTNRATPRDPGPTG